MADELTLSTQEAPGITLGNPEFQKVDFLTDLQGQSLYTSWLELGNEGTKADFLSWLKGNSPYIGENGNWWVGTEDTGVKPTSGVISGDISSLIAMTQEEYDALPVKNQYVLYLIISNT